MKLRSENTEYRRKRDVFAVKLDERRRTVLDRFMTTVDDFTETTLYTHRTQPLQDQRPYISMYINREKAGTLSLHFVLNYTSSYGWLFVRGADANVDGHIISIPEAPWKRGHNTKIWEWITVA